MCGIIGFISKEADENKIKKITDLISHRGPDYQNYSIIQMNDKFLHLGSSRLSIRGSETENMPMIDDENINLSITERFLIQKRFIKY